MQHKQVENYLTHSMKQGTYEALDYLSSFCSFLQEIRGFAEFLMVLGFIAFRYS